MVSWQCETYIRDIKQSYMIQNECRGVPVTAYIIMLGIGVWLSNMILYPLMSDVL